MELTKFMKYYTIEQKIKITDPSKPITGYLNFMTCNDERCIAPSDVEFELFAADATEDPDNKKAEVKAAEPKVAVKTDKKVTAETPEKKKITEATPTTPPSSSIILKVDSNQYSGKASPRSEEHTSELQSPCNLVCRILLEKTKRKTI